jgi:5-oxoprolinase (ATP-hydrolysing) subunit A
MLAVDLNCDLGEGMGHDADLMPLISSANIACGGHAGDEATMRATIKLAKQHHVAIGAHPGFPDPQHFGRRLISASEHEVYSWVLAQTKLLQALASDCDARVSHVKPHGALYNLAAGDPAMARALAAAVYEADPQLRLIGLAGSRLLEAGSACGLKVASEVFADRTYQADGSLTPRARPDALLADETQVVSQVLQMIQSGKVTATDGREVSVQADTICLHGDGGGRAVTLARAVKAALQSAGVIIRA